MPDRRRRVRALLVGLLLVMTAATLPQAAVAATPVPATTIAAQPTVEQLVGAKLLVVMGGTSPTK